MDTSSWKWFRYDEIFDINSFRGDTLQDLKEGDIPYISTTEDNNGVIGHVDATSFCDGNKITVSRNGSVGISFYQPYKFYPSPDDIRIFTLKDNVLNPYIGLFLCVLIEKERYRYTYGRKFGTNRMKTSLIKLPVTPEGTPDWKYMEDFVKDQIIPQLPKKAQRVWLQKYDTTPQKQEDMKLNTQDWKWFNYTDLFIISGSKTTPIEELETYGKGKYPYVTTQAVNNGVEGYYNYCTEKGGVLTVDSAVLGFCSYQENDFSASDHVEVLTPLFEMNRYIAIFLVTLINKEQYRYSYGRKCSQIKLRNSKIKLPATPSGEPDWKFMEDYIKSLPFSRNIEPSMPNEVVDELVEMKKEMIKMRRAMEAQQSGSITNYGTLNIYEK